MWLLDTECVTESAAGQARKSRVQPPEQARANYDPGAIFGPLNLFNLACRTRRNDINSEAVIKLLHFIHFFVFSVFRVVLNKEPCECFPVQGLLS